MQELQPVILTSKLSHGHFFDMQGKEACSADEWKYADGEPTILSEEDRDSETSNRGVAGKKENASDNCTIQADAT